MDNSRTAPTNWRDPASFDAIYKVRPGETWSRIWRAAYGDDYPAEVEPHSFLTRTDLARVVHHLALGAGDVLVDLGCGRGGPGLWLAREMGADQIGVDLSPNAIALAEQRVAEFGLAGRARYLRGDLCATGLPDESCDGAISIDVVMFVPDRAAAMREVARILRPGARMAFTTFESKQTDSWRPHLEDNGFEIEVYREKPDWRRRQFALYKGAIREQAALVAELGEGARTLVAEAKELLANGMAHARHVFVVGRKR